MIQVFLYAFAAGLIWCIVGVLYGKAPSEKKAFYTFYLLYTLLYSTSSFFTTAPARVPATELLKVACFVVPLSLLSLGGFLLLKKAMETGSQGIAWCISQSAVVVPFIGSVLFLHSTPSYLQWTGLLILGISLICLGCAKQKASGKAGKGYLKYSMFAFALLGLSQFLQLIPGHIGCSEDALSWRIFLSTPTGIIVWISVCVKQKAFEWRKVWKMSTLYAVIVLIGQIVFYKAVDAADATKMTAVAYPIAIGTCIFLFALYCAIFRHEKITLASGTGILLNVTGVILLSVK